MGPLIKALGAAAGAILTVVTASVISKNEEDRKEWLDEMGRRADDAAEKVGDFLTDAYDKAKDALS